MIEFLTSPFAFAALSSFILGVSKAGLKGFGFVIVSLMAVAYGSKPSTGILLPLLVFADIFAVVAYRKDVDWKTLWKIMPPMIVGVIIGSLIGDKISVEQFKFALAIIILSGGIMMIVAVKMPKDKIPDNQLFATIMGLGAGITTMIGNLAGAFANLYFLALRFSKEAFIGTAAYMFFIINIFKLPFHIFSWGTITVDTLWVNLTLAPFVAVGFAVGYKLIKYISNSFFQKYIIFMTILSALLILL